jgi:hypothetical protein
VAIDGGIPDLLDEEYDVLGDWIPRVVHLVSIDMMLFGGTSSKLSPEFVKEIEVYLVVCSGE